MGITISKVAEWKTINNGKSYTLPLRSTINQVIFEEITTFLSIYSVKYPQESRYVFKKALVWNSTIEKEELWYGFVQHGKQYFSHGKDEEGKPLVIVNASLRGPMRIAVRTIEELENVISMVSDRKYDEIRACLEENQDPIGLILGEEFSLCANPGLAEMLLKQEEDGGDVKASTEERLTKQLNDFDLQIHDTLVQLDNSVVEYHGIIPSKCLDLPNSIANVVNELVHENTNNIITNDCTGNQVTQPENKVVFDVSVASALNPSNDEDINNSMFMRSYSNICSAALKRYNRREYTDITTQWRMNSVKNENLCRQSKKPVDSDSSQSDGEEYNENTKIQVELAPEYWQISKLVNYIRGGIPTSTIISLCALRDMDLTLQINQLALRDVGGIKVLINLLETNEVRCIVSSLKVLIVVSENPAIRQTISDLRGIQALVGLLDDTNWLVRCLAAENIASISRFSRARRSVRKENGIQKLVAMLDINSNFQCEIEMECARYGAMALWTCSQSFKNKVAMKKAGVIILMTRLLKSRNVDLLIPVVGTLEECATMPEYRSAIRTEGMVKYITEHMKTDIDELQMHCANVLFKCAEDLSSRNVVRENGGITTLVNLLSKQNKELLAAACGAIWKCAIQCPANIEHFQKLHTIEKLVNILSTQGAEVMKPYLKVNSVSVRIKNIGKTESELINVVGALGEMAKVAANRAIIRKCGGIPPLINLLTNHNHHLLINVLKAIGECAIEPDSLSIIIRMDGVRLLWSILKFPRPDVQATAAWAICPCIDNTKEAGEMVRSFVGGLELVVRLLYVPEIEVRASICAVIARIAKDTENLAVITDHGVIPLLAQLTYTKKDRLRRNLSEAIARCCEWRDNRVKFGEAGAVAPLVDYLNSSDPNVHRATAQALEQLSRHPENCLVMRQAGTVKRLVDMISSSDAVLQEAAVATISNIRALSLIIRDPQNIKTKKSVI